jgi:hypothetical protein
LRSSEEKMEQGKRKEFFNNFAIRKRERSISGKDYSLDHCSGCSNKWLSHLWQESTWRRSSKDVPRVQAISFFLRERDPRRGTGGIFLSGSDLHRGHYSRDDVVIRYAGFHDAAFDVNCEERRSRSRFIPPVVCIVVAAKGRADIRPSSPGRARVSASLRPDLHTLRMVSAPP